MATPGGGETPAPLGTLYRSSCLVSCPRVIAVVAGSGVRMYYHTIWARDQSRSKWKNERALRAREILEAGVTCTVRLRCTYGEAAKVHKEFAIR